MPTSTPAVRRWLGAMSLVALAGGAMVLGCRRSTEEPAGPSISATPVPSAPADIEKEVHAFCGSACHAYPPPETFPRRHWKAEVERGFHFFEQSGRSMAVPPIEAVVRYYEHRAPEELPPAELRPEPYPLPVKFEQVSYPPPPGGKAAVSHLSLVRLARPRAASGPLDVLATDMQNGRIMLLSPAD